jgi:hypothetical protein
MVVTVATVTAAITAAVIVITDTDTAMAMDTEAMGMEATATDTATVIMGIRASIKLKYSMILDKRLKFCTSNFIKLVLFSVLNFTLCCFVNKKSLLKKFLFQNVYFLK